jgi:hypothetical protein
VSCAPTQTLLAAKWRGSAHVCATTKRHHPVPVENMLEEADLDIMARINAQNDAKDRENAERAAASKCPGCAPPPTVRARFFMCSERSPPLRAVGTEDARGALYTCVLPPPAGGPQSSGPSWW